ncbi:MAG: RimK/LysX family protein [Proteobacteria bacterium]|nr:RimK/LysX family protein [Pseudomonadota bacterium]
MIKDPKSPRRRPRLEIGWREWVGLPDLGIENIKAKIDTGARTSALHAYRILRVRKGSKHYVRFLVHPVQRRKTPEVECLAPLVDQRTVRDSGGKTEHRYVISTTLRLGEDEWPVEITLTNRDEMSFRMLLGRAGIRDHCTINPGTSYHMGRPAKVKSKAKTKARTKARNEARTEAKTGAAKKSPALRTKKEKKP